MGAKLLKSTGEPCAVKVASTVRRGGDWKSTCKGNSLAPYPTPKPRGVVSANVLRIRFCGGANGVAPHRARFWRVTHGVIVWRMKTVTISEIISVLEERKRVHGDIPVCFWDGYWNDVTNFSDIWVWEKDKENFPEREKWVPSKVLVCRFDGPSIYADGDQAKETGT